MATVDGASVPTSLAAARNKVFMQAKKGSPWHKAMRRRDCVELKRRLTEDPSAGPQLLRQVYRQNTALHIAVRQGCADLVTEIVENLFGDAGKIEVDDGNDEFTLIQLLDAVNDEEVTATTIAFEELHNTGGHLP